MKLSCRVASQSSSLTSSKPRMAPEPTLLTRTSTYRPDAARRASIPPATPLEVDRSAAATATRDAEGFRLRLHLVHARLVDVEQPEVGALAGEADGARAADAVGGAGDEHDLIAQSGVHSGFPP